MRDSDIAIAINVHNGRITIGAGCRDRRAINRNGIDFSSGGHKAAKLLGAGDVMAGGHLHIERIAHSHGIQRYIACVAHNNLAIGINLSVQIQLSVEDFSRIVRVTRCEQQGRGARARGQHFGESGHWMLLFGRRKSYAG